MFDKDFFNAYEDIRRRKTGCSIEAIEYVFLKMGYFDLKFIGNKKGKIANIRNGEHVITVLCGEDLSSLTGIALGKMGEKSCLVIHTNSHDFKVYDVKDGKIGENIFSIDFQNSREDELALFFQLNVHGDINSFIFEVKKRKIACFIMMNYLNPDAESFEYIANRLGIPNSYDFKLEVLKVLSISNKDKKVESKKSLVDVDTSVPITNVSYDIEGVLHELEDNGLCYYPDSSYKTGFRLTVPDTVVYGAEDFVFKSWRDVIVQIITCVVNTNKVVAKKLLRLRAGMTLNFFSTQEEVERFCSDLNYKNGEQGIKKISDNLYMYIWGNPTMAITSLYSILLKAGANVDALRFEYIV